MASLLARIVASFDAIKPVPNLTGLDGEHNQLVGASGVLNGGTTASKLLVKTSDGSDPPIDQDQVGAGLLARWKQNGSSKATITNDGSVTANGLTGAAGIYTFGSIPVGPAADPTTSNQLARKAYIDNRKVRWSASFFISDPSTFPTNSFNQVQKAKIPASTTFVAEGAALTYSTGTASGSFTVELRTHPFADQTTQTILATITINPGTVGVETFVDISPDVSLTQGSYCYPILTARSSPLQKDVTISLFGYQTPE